MRSILSLINKYFWKGMIGPVFAYFIPMVLVLFIGRILGAHLIIPGAFFIPVLSILLVFLPQSIFEFRSSSLLKRIGTTPIKPMKFLLGISLFNFLIVISALILIFVFCFAVFADSETTKNLIPENPPYQVIVPSYIDLIKHADWASFFYFLLLVIIMCILIALFVASVAKSTLFIQCVGIGIMLIAFFVGPCVLPISLVASVDVVKWLGYLIPLKYPISSAIEAFTSRLDHSMLNLNSSNVWDIHSQYVVINILYTFNPTKGDLKITVFDPVDKVLNLVLPWVFNLIFLYFVAATFRWNNRGSVKWRWDVFTQFIHHIKEEKQLTQHQQHSGGNVNSKNILEVKNITRKFKNKNGVLVANDDISFNLVRGRNLAILGHNGAGKSVLVETIVGVTPPQEGNIVYNFEYKKSFNEKIGIQFQDSSYPYGIRVKDIISFFIKSYKLVISDEELQELVKKFGVDSFFNKNAGSLSGGQQQRVNLLLSVIHRPKVLFLDELSTGLDIKIRNEIKDFIKDYAKKNDMTLVIVSHDMGEVDYLADDILILKNGQIQYFGTKKEIKKKYHSLEDFVYKYL